MTKRKDPADLKKAGRKTKYKTEYNTKEYLQGYFDQCEEKKEIVSLCGLAVYIGVCEDTLQEWKNVHPQFSVSLKNIKQRSKNMLVNGGLNSTYNSTIAKLILSANHGMKEKTDITTNDDSITIAIPTKFKDI